MMRLWRVCRSAVLCAAVIMAVNDLKLMAATGTFIPTGSMETPRILAHRNTACEWPRPNYWRLQRSGP